MSHNLPNGIPQQINKSEDKPIPSTQYPLNGIGSSHSSRDPSPSFRFHQIPASQLPPSRTNIPVSQLPHSATQSGPINQLTQNYAHLTVSNGNSRDNTPFSSPGPPKFATSTPTLEPAKTVAQQPENIQTKFSSAHFDKNSAFLAVKTSSQQGVQGSAFSQFSHSPLSQFANVPLLLPGGSKKPISQNVLTNKQNQGSNKGVGNTAPIQSEEVPQAIAQASNQLYNENHKHGQVQMKLANSQQYPAPLSGQVQQPYMGIAQVSHHSQTSAPSKLNQQHSGTQPDVVTQPNYNFEQPFVAPAFVSQSVLCATNSGSSQARPSLQHNFSQPQLSTYSVPNQSVQQHHVPFINPLLKNLPLSGSSPNISKPSSEPQFPSLGPSHPEFISQPSIATNYTQKPQQIQQLHVSNQINNPGNVFPHANQINQPANVPAIQKQVTPASTESFQPYPMSLGGVKSQPELPAVQNAPYKSVLQGSRYPAPLSNQVPYQNSAVNQPAYPQQQPQGYFQNQTPNVYQPQMPKQDQNQYYQSTSQSVTQSGFNKLWGAENHDLLQSPSILPPTKIEPPKVSLGQDLLDSVNCTSEIFRSTMTKVPESSSLLAKARLPLGVLIHPFKDLNHLPVIQCNTIVRCRACRTYINPFVFFVDTKRWKCNICYRINELPEEFQYDPVSKTYGDPSRRPEVRASTIEYIAPAEYMLRPPQPAVYLYLLDVSRAAVESGYLRTFCSVLASELNNIPGDARTQIGFLAYDSALHFYSLAEGLSQPHEMTVLDIDDVFLPCPDNLLVNLNDKMGLISDLLEQLPTRYNNSFDAGSALGAALQVAHKMMSATGGRVTVFHASLPNIGPGALISREDPSQRASVEVQHLNPANDFYKRLALECSGQQIAVDMFLLNSQYVDLATISGISRFSGGCIHHFPLYKAERTLQSTSLERTFKRYLTRKIGFEAVMRIRCTRGLAIHTFHGNFFVRSTDLLSLPNVNPDSGFAMQVSIDENLSDLQSVCFQAALLYTSSKGERRIRVHTLCLPVVSTLSDVINSADQQCIVGLLSKMAVDRSAHSSLSDAREAFINVAIDILSSYKLSLNLGSGPSGLMAPQCLRLLPLYISAILKHIAFRTGTSTRLDDRVKAMCDMKTKPLPHLIQLIYPDLYPIHNLENQSTAIINEDEDPVPMPPHLQLTARNLDSNGAYLLDMGEHMVIIVGAAVSQLFINQVLGLADYGSIPDNMYELPVLENPYNHRLHTFVNFLNDEKPFVATMQILRDNSQSKGVFLEKLIEDRIETALSYHEFLQHLKSQVK